MAVHDPRIFFEAILARLTGSGVTVGDGQAPTDAETPYAVLHALAEDDDPEAYGTLADPHSATIFHFQLTCVGATATEARGLQAKVRTALQGWIPTVAGMTCGQVAHEPGLPDQIDDPTLPAQVLAFERFSCFASANS